MNERINIKIDELKKIKAFGELGHETIGNLFKCVVVKQYKKSEVIFFEKDQIDKMYAVVRGKVEMSRYSGSGQKRLFFILNQGEIINETVFDDFPVSVVCKTYEECLIAEFRKTDILKIMESDFKLTMNIMNSMGKKQRRLYRQLKNTVPIKMDKRLAAKLWKLARDYGKDQEEWVKITMKISVTDLSYMLGSSRETISRAMKVLVDKEIVMWQGRKLLVKEDELLKYYRN